MATVLFHVSPSANRESIRRFGLDWRRMGTEHNIPGAIGAEQAGIFLSRDREEARWFVAMGRHLHGELDVWEVTLAHDFDAEDRPLDMPCRIIDGFLCWTQPIEPTRIRLLRSPS
ncbi:hypothetical protein DVA67_007245 [Solirubrobacter sp. CPCC 204708]|uniref:DUF3303 domain-containing protein n=1 Tax=Solirubrobacter deserti TaxID=2282478 RepID=A0ABT4RK13_9ACTN|nr:hypothetical protein [Solirubrobacter deserti]MBE2315765.1 hypothetical protein [Solirubrobacter deserti]MDA0138897.1 hypothetical protein [Solirubrobacter deserti]